MYWRTKRLHCSSKDTPLPVLRLFVLFGSAFIVVHVWTVWETVRGLWNPTQEIVSRSNNAIPERTLSYYQSSMTSNPQNWGLDRLIPKILHHSKQLRGTQTGILGPKEIQTDWENKRAIAAVGGGAPSGGQWIFSRLVLSMHAGLNPVFLVPNKKHANIYIYIYGIYWRYIYIYMYNVYIIVIIIITYYYP